MYRPFRAEWFNISGSFARNWIILFPLGFFPSIPNFGVGAPADHRGFRLRARHCPNRRSWDRLPVRKMGGGNFPPAFRQKLVYSPLKKIARRQKIGPRLCLYSPGPKQALRRSGRGKAATKNTKPVVF